MSNKRTCPIRYNKETGKEYICNLECAFADRPERHDEMDVYCTMRNLFALKVDIEGHIDTDVRNKEGEKWH